MTPEDQPPEPLEILHRREKRLFWWTCGWLGALLLAWVGGGTAAYFAQKRYIEMVIAAGDFLPAADAYFNRLHPWLVALRLLIVFLTIAFFVCLVRWLLAIRRRRRETLKYGPFGSGR